MFLTSIMIRIKLFIEDREGASAIEYAVVAAMVAVVAITFIAPIGAQVKAVFNEILHGLGGTAI